jgi:hypothetical protein
MAMASTTRSLPGIVKLLIFLEIFLGINGLVGGIPFILAPDGHLIQMPFSQLQNTPFTSFFIPGVLLTLFLGVYPLAAAYSVWKLPGWHWPDVINPLKAYHWSWAGSLAVGAIAIIWIIVQIQWIQVGALHVFVLVWGALILAVSLLPGVRLYCRNGAMQLAGHPR